MHRFLSALRWLGRAANPFDPTAGQWLHVAVLVVVLVATNAGSFVGGRVYQRALDHHVGGYVPTSVKVRPMQIGGASVPASYSLDRFVRYIVDQGSSESCVAQSMAQMEQIDMAQRGRPWKWSPGYIYDQLTQGLQIPTNYSDAFPLAQQAFATYRQFPWDGQDSYPQPSWATTQAAKPYRLGSWRYIDATDQTGVEYEISHGRAVVLAMPWYDTLVYDTGAPVDGQWGALHYWHSTTVDAYSPWGVQIVNSFGSGWGANGRTWISWRTIANSWQGGIQAAFAVGNPVLPPPQPKPPVSKPTFSTGIWNQFRREHHKKLVPYKLHGKFTYAASLWLKHAPKRTGGILGPERWDAHNRVMRTSFQGFTLYDWPTRRGYKPKWIRRKWAR